MTPTPLPPPKPPPPRTDRKRQERKIEPEIPIQKAWGSRVGELCNDGLEKNLLASIIINPQSIDRVLPVVSAADFSDETISKAFEATVNLHRAGRPVSDIRLLLSDWKSMGVSGSLKIDELIKVVRETPNGAHAIYYAEGIAALSARRKLLALADEIGNAVIDPRCNVDDMPGLVDAKMRVLSNGSRCAAKPIDAVWSEVIGDMQSRVGRADPAVLLSGLPAADSRGFVFGCGELAVLAARPGVGKTSLATQIAMHHAGKGRPVLFASLEMRDRELALRPLVAASGHNHQIIRTTRIDQQMVDDMQSARASLGEIPLFVWSPGRVTAAAIHAQAAILKSTSDLRMLIVDYIGLVKPEDRGRERYEQVGQIVKSLRDIGQQLQIPVLALCQLNREADGNEPKLSNLRESGDIEQDADVVAFLHQTDARDSTKVDLIIAKARNSGVGRANLIWHKEQTIFEDPTIAKRFDDFDQFNRGEFG